MLSIGRAFQGVFVGRTQHHVRQSPHRGRHTDTVRLTVSPDQPQDPEGAEGRECCMLPPRSPQDHGFADVLMMHAVIKPSFGLRITFVYWLPDAVPLGG